MNTIRRNLLTSHPNIGFTARVTTAVPMKSHRMASSPPFMPMASRAGRITPMAVRMTRAAARLRRAAR
jgi:hypothetical protein